MNNYIFGKWYYYDDNKYIRYCLDRRYTEQYDKTLYVIIALYGDNDDSTNVFIYYSLELAVQVMNHFLELEKEGAEIGNS